MKHIALFIGLLLVLFACAPQNDASDNKIIEPDTATQSISNESTFDLPKENTSAPKTQVELVSESEPTAEPAPQTMPTDETITAQDVVETVVAPSQPRTRMYRFLDAFAKVSGYQFEHKGNKYFVKGPLYKIVLGQPAIVKNVKFGEVEKSLFYYDTIYLDKNQKTAVAYCEGYTSQVNQQCTKLDLYDLALPVSYDEYSVVLPEDWLYSYLNTEPDLLEENKYYIEGRATVFAKFEGTPVFELNFDRASGLVLRVDQMKGSSLIARLDYEDLVTNLVRDVDVRHRSKSEIPSSEAFMR